MTNDYATLQLYPEKRLKGEATSTDKTQREFLDFVVDGQSLWHLTQDAGLDLVSCLILPDVDAMTVRKLLAQEPSDLPQSRFVLYVCPECGDLGCGALTVHIELVGDTVIWKDFVYQNNYDKSMHFVEQFQHLGPFHFEKRMYTELMRDLATGR